MLEKKARLGRQEFSKYFKTGRRYNSQNLTVIVAAADTFKGAVVVSKKVSKSAVCRNKWRRRLYATLSLFRKDNDRIKNVYIVLAKPSLNNITRKEARDELLKVLKTVIN